MGFNSGFKGLIERVLCFCVQNLPNRKSQEADVSYNQKWRQWSFVLGLDTPQHLCYIFRHCSEYDVPDFRSVCVVLCSLHSTTEITSSGLIETP